MKRLIWDLRHHLFLWPLVNVEHTFIWGHFCLQRALMATSLMGTWGLPQYLQRVWGTQEKLCDERLHQATVLAPPPPPGQAGQPQYHKEETRLEWCETTTRLHAPPLALAHLWARHYWALSRGHSNALGNWVLLGQQLFATCIVSFCAEWQFKCDNCEIISLREETKLSVSTPKQF